MRLVVTLFAAAALAACGGGEKPVDMAAPAADKPAPSRPRRLAEETTVSTASGATFTASAGWTVDDGMPGRVVLTTPEGDMTLTLVEVAAADREAATRQAWTRVRPGFDLAIARADDLPARDGWDAVGQTAYVTPAAERRVVVAVACRKADTWYVLLLDGRLDAMGRRGAQIQTVLSSLKSQGMEKESFAGKQAHPLDAARLASLESFVEEARVMASVPGVAITVVQGGKVVLEKGFGQRRLGDSAPVDPRTLFMIGSTTKRLTALMMGRLVDAGRFGWDTPVTRLLPSFALGDAATTRAVTMRHTLCACTGMPRQDMEFIFEYGQVTPEQRLASMKEMKPTTGFGETFQYSNLMVSAGGFAAARAHGSTGGLGKVYDAAMQELLFAPLGMKSTTFDFARTTRSRHATPHARDLMARPAAISLGDEHVVIPVRPAGGLWSSAHDMARVLLLELGDGQLDGKRIVSAAGMAELRRPQVKIDATTSYGLGLFVEQVGGVPILGHGGNTIGFSSDFFYLPEHGVGMVVLTNLAASNPFNAAVRRRLIELLFDGRPEARDDLAASLERTARAAADEAKLVDARLDPAWFDHLAGRWTNPGLGTIELRREKETATLDAGEWKVRVARKTDRDGTVKLVTTGAPLPGIELVPREESGQTVLLLEDVQQTYVFERK